MNTARLARIGHLIKQELSLILTRKVKDPRIGFVSITDVDVSPDIKNAKIFISVLGDDEAKKHSLKGLESASKYIRCELAKVLDIKFMPDINFYLDDSIERGSKILSLMYHLKKDENAKTNHKKNKRTNKKK